MAIKKSELYSSLWASCDELRGGMDASQYKDYVLVMLFIKYISDRYANIPYSPIKVPPGSSFQDMVALKGTSNIGEDINTKIIEPIALANKLSEMPDFNNKDKLGDGAEMVSRLTNLIAIFENPALDFKKNRAEGDDILGDAYEYLMRHFATESGKSKGQFYTPAEVSRIKAKIIGITSQNTTPETSVYDPTSGSGSLVIKLADEAGKQISIFGQEIDLATASLARMNMILHNHPTAVIKQGNTLSNPLFKDEQGRLKTFDYSVSNPPFSFKSWSNGVNIAEEQKFGGRFYGYGVPPAKNGDYAFLLHILKSMHSKSKATIILPHGVLFRGNAEAEIRKNLINKGVIKGIIGLPPNLFYGTGIPACIIVLDKENATSRKSIFMIDASKGFMKDGNKNRLRSQDIHKIVDVFNNRIEIPKYSRAVPIEEIADPKNDYNLNIPRYIDSQDEEDIQDIAAHLSGGIPARDIEALDNYWKAFPTLKAVLFKPTGIPCYFELTVPVTKLKETIFDHPGFTSFTELMDQVFIAWKNETTAYLKSLGAGMQPKKLIHTISENLLNAYSGKPLTDKYSVYQFIMDYWAETMQDDCYIIAADGWKAVPYRILEKSKSGKQADKGWACDLVPKAYIVNRYYAEENAKLENLQNQLETIIAERTQLEEEHSVEDGAFADMEKINKAEVKIRFKELREEITAYPQAAEPKNLYGEEKIDDETVLEKWQQLGEEEIRLKKEIKEADSLLDKKAFDHYASLNQVEIKTLVVDDKWMVTLESSIRSEIENISQRLTQRIKQLTERYETPLPKQTTEVSNLEAKVNAHLQKMGFVWK